MIDLSSWIPVVLCELDNYCANKSSRIRADNVGLFTKGKKHFDMIPSGKKKHG
ncbi:hypothetical protein SAMN06265368_0252 [Cohaesibacter gelatinilyticus]|uniref:Uncharacterized protein n=1 Tax=Cohaesibacter gelatinilyticus TaxID=372072 RepID=A0A285N905_9HYPH|nr:hypothetical protein SAMN06265368_0252 [Cohaesibacter gelatinilyticus]